jgi:predicted nucleic acid-binding Zn ribbon protein
MPSPRGNRGRWAVARERFHLDETAQPEAGYRLSPVGDLLPRIMKGFGLEDRFWEQTLMTEWDKVVGAQVAKHARPGRVQRQTLFVFVKSSAWLSELTRYGQKQILANVQARFGADKIKSVRIQLDPDFPPQR